MQKAHAQHTNTQIYIYIYIHVYIYIYIHIIAYYCYDTLTWCVFFNLYKTIQSDLVKPRFEVTLNCLKWERFWSGVSLQKSTKWLWEDAGRWAIMSHQNPSISEKIMKMETCKFKQKKKQTILCFHKHRPKTAEHRILKTCQGWKLSVPCSAFFKPKVEETWLEFGHIRKHKRKIQLLWNM